MTPLGLATNDSQPLLHNSWLAGEPSSHSLTPSSTIITSSHVGERSVILILNRDHLICYEKSTSFRPSSGSGPRPSRTFSHVNNLGYELAPKPLVAFEMFLARLSSKRSVFPILTRSASSVTRPRGLAAILEKKPDDVVITFAKRTAVGRAKKGQLKDAPVDEILHALFKVLNPQI